LASVPCYLSSTPWPFTRRARLIPRAHYAMGVQLCNLSIRRSAAGRPAAARCNRRPQS
jgi:hypothetical protein